MAKKTNKKEKRCKQDVATIRSEDHKNIFAIKKVVDPSEVLFQMMHNICFDKVGYFGECAELRILSKRIREENLGIIEKKALNQLIRFGKRHGFFRFYSYKERIEDANISVIHNFVNLAKERCQWINKPEDFILSSREPILDNVYNLIKFLLIKYEVPHFFKCVWSHPEKESKLNRLHKRWFFNLGFGENIRNQNGLPFKLTKKQAHFLNESPHNSSVVGAFRWAQLKGMGFEQRAIDGIMSLPMESNIHSINNDFWVTVFYFFANNPFLNTSKYREIYDYISNIRFGEEALEPNFSMKGRSPESLMLRVDQWHEQLNRQMMLSGKNRNVSPIWEPSDTKPYLYKISNKEDIKIVEINSSVGLYDEGKAMHHCVWSYNESCSKGIISIFSMRLYKEGELCKSLVTIEVDRQRGLVVQARGVCNALISILEMKILSDWAKKSNFKISKIC